MNAPAKNFDKACAVDPRPVDELALWRGRCLDAIARGEAAIAAALIALAADEAARARCNSFGHRISDLEAALQGNAEHARASNALRRFKRAASVRSFLAHGTIRRFCNQQGKPLLHLRLPAETAYSLPCDYLLSMADAETLREELQRAVQSLAAVLSNLAGSPVTA